MTEEEAKIAYETTIPIRQAAWNAYKEASDTYTRARNNLTEVQERRQYAYNTYVDAQEIQRNTVSA